MNAMIFVGPSAHGLDLRALCDDHMTIRSPVRRGDIEKLSASDELPDTIIIVDGTFHSYPSVGHAELRSAVEHGTQVWGLSSMGALRAAEMTSLGVRGFGRVFRAYADNPDFDDDEVALLHGTEHPFRPVSEPLIHIRTLVDDTVTRGVLSAERAAAVIEHLKNRWYGDRTLPLVRQALTSIGRLDADLAAGEVARIDRFRLKTIDLVDFLTTTPWKTDRNGRKS